ncbi:MAG TPA: SDR family oxidoreductase [Actinomycetota bacterium]|jgi:NAD(P)-dependent dehydrogenase (short-subunit alcohol dehydrogenase family)
MTEGALAGRVSIVTGGAQGIGRAYCLGLAAEGSIVVVADLMDGSAVAREIEAMGGRALALEVDVSDPSATRDMASKVMSEFERIDVLVNNAAYFKQARRGPFTDIDPDEWDRAFHVNVRGTWLCCRAVHPHMKAGGYGKIINVSSNTPFKGVPGFLHYTSSKSAIIGLTRALAREVGDDGIAVNTVAPDFIPDEEMLRNRAADAAVVLAERCFQRTQTPGDMVGIVVFLAGPGSDFITGQSFLVNGGALFQ